MNTLIQKAKQIRLDVLDLSEKHQNGHIASALSFVEILTFIYERLLTSQDQFILSKGHGVLALYAMLIDKGYNPIISGHPDIEPNQGIMCTTGSLGHGLAIGAGKALAKKLKNENGKIFVIIGDGECQEGSIWETFNLIRKFKLNNIVTIVDNNNFQALDTIGDILDENNLKNKFEAFGINVILIDGHNFQDIKKAFNKINKNLDKPFVVIAKTVKGKGISFMENVPCWHSKMLNKEEMEIAIKEIKIGC